MKKILLTALLLITCIAGGVKAAEKTSVAKITFDSSTPGVSNVTIAQNDGYKNENIGDKACWVLGTTNADKTSITLDFNTSVAKSGIDNYILDVTYYDYGRGRFFISYYNHKLGEVETKPVLCEGTNQWKTVSVEIYGMKADNRLIQNGDLKIYNYSKDWNYSPDNVYIASAELYRTGTDNTAKIALPEGADTNFYKEKQQQLTYTFTNIGSERRTFTPQYTVLDDKGNVIWSGTGNAVAASKNGSKSVTVDMDVKKYGVHTFIVEITDNLGGYSKSTVDIGVQRYEDTPVKNPDLGISAHFSWSDKLVSTMELYDQMGAGFLRDEVLWKDYSANNNAIPERHLNYLNEAIDAGVEPLLILGFGHPDYDNGQLPVSDAGLKAYGEYVYNLVSDLKGKVTYFEVWNEHNCTAMGDSEKTMKTAGKEYAKLLKVAYTEAKRANPECKVVGLVSAGWSYDFGVGMKEFDSNIGNYMDIMSFHEYGHERKPESTEYINALIWSVDTMKEFFGDKEVWLTEYGWADNVYGITETEAAMWDIRFCMYNQDMKIVDKMFRYTWNDNGYSPGNYEYTLGVITHNYAVKKIYLAYQNMNYMLSGTTLSEHTVDENKNHIYKYKIDDKTNVTVLFNENDVENEATLTVANSKICVFDMYGNLEVETEVNGEYKVLTNGEPQYIISTKIPEIAATYDFNDVADGTLPGGLAVYSSGANLGCYKTVDKVYGNSMLLEGTTGFTYNFGNIVNATKTVTFDVKRTGNAAGEQMMIFAGAGNLSYSKEILMELTNSNAKFGYANASPKSVPFSQDEWYTVDMQITGNGTNSTVNYYVDGEYVGTFSDRPLMDKITFFGHWSKALTPYIDNLTIRNIAYVSPKIKVKGDFNFNNGKNGNGNFDAKLTDGWVQANSGDTWWNNYKKIDNAHGLSLGTKGGSGFCYPLENAISKDGILSFEIYTDDISDTKGFFVEGQKGGLWDNNMLVLLKGAEMQFGGVSKKYAIEPNTWYKVDLKLLYDNNNIVQYYVNGEYIGEAKRDGINAVYCKSDNRSAFVYMDNVEFKIPHYVTRFEATAPLQIPELNENTIKLDFGATVNKNTLNEDGIMVEKADGTVVEVEATRLNTRADGVVITLKENLENNVQYKVTLPDGIKSVFEDECTTKELIFTTAKAVNCYENFNDDTLIEGFAKVVTADGKAVIGEDAYGDFTYELPYTVTSGQLKMSYDLTVTQKAGTSGAWAIMNLYGTNSFGSNQMIQWNTTPLYDWKSLGYTWEIGKSYHYDFIFNLDETTVTMYQNGVEKVLSGESAAAISKIMIYAETNKGLVFDNFRIAYTKSGAEFPEVFEFENISIKDGEADITLENWDGTKAYKLSVDVTNSKSPEKKVIATVAGYAGDRLVNIQNVDLTITASGNYKADLKAMSMEGVTNIKFFVFDSLATLSPLVDTPFEI